MTAADAVALLERLLPVVVFLLAITVVAEVAERAGVFDVAGHWVAHAGRHRAWALWLLFALLAVGCTVVLSLDTTAVLLTPVGLAVARQVDLDARVFAVTTLWIANTGSLLLPVSNLTNLLALNTFERQGLGHADYVRLAWAPALACIVVTLALVALLHRRTLGVVRRRPTADPHDVVLLRWAAGVCVVLGPLFALGAPPWAVSLVAAAVLLAVPVAGAAAAAGLPVPWLMAAGFVACRSWSRCCTSVAGRPHRLGRAGGTGPRPRRPGGTGALVATSRTTCRPTSCSSRSRPTRRRADGAARRGQRRAARHPVGLAGDAAVAAALPHRRHGRAVALAGARGHAAPCSPWPQGPAPWPSPPDPDATGDVPGPCDAGHHG